MGDKVPRRMEQEQLLYNQHEDTASSSTSIITSRSSSSYSTSRTRRPASSYFPTLDADGDELGGAKERSLDAKERKRRGGTVTGLVALDGGEEEREESEAGEEASRRFQARPQRQLKRLSLRIREKLHLAFTSNNNSSEQPTRPARDSHYHQNSQSLPHSPKFLSTSEPPAQLQPAAQPLTSSRSSPSFSSSSSFFSTPPSNSPAGSTPTSPKGRRAGLSSSVSPRARQQQAVVPNRVGDKEKKSQQEEKKSKKKGGSRGHKARGGGSAAGDDRKTEDNSDSSNNVSTKHKNKKKQKKKKREGGNDDNNANTNDNEGRPSPRMQGGSSKRLGGMFHFSSRSKDKAGSLEEDAMMMATAAAATTSSPTRSRTTRKNEGGDEKARKIVKSDEGKGGGNAGKSSSPDLENRGARRGLAKIGIRVEGSIDGEEEEEREGVEGQDDLDAEEEEGQYDEEKGWILPTTDIELLIEAFASASPLQGSSSGESTPVLGWVSKRPTSPRGGEQLLEVGSPKKKENMRLRLSASLSSFAFSPISSSKKQAPPPSAGPESQSAQVKAASDAASAAGKKQKDGKFRFLHLQRSSAQLPLPSAASASAPSLPTVDKESSSAHTLRSRTPSKEELKQIKLERKTAKKLEKLEKKKNKRDSNGENSGGKKRSSRRSNAGAGSAGSADKDSDGTRSITSSQEKSTDDDNEDGELGPVPSDGGCSLHTTFDEHQLLLVGAGASSPGLDELLEIEIAKLKEEEALRTLRKQQEKLNKAAEQQHRQQREEAAAALVAKKSSERGELKTSTEWRSGRISPVPGEERTTVVRSGLRRSEEGAKKPLEPAVVSNVQPAAEAVATTTTTTTAAWQYDSSDEDELDEEHGWIDPARVVGSQLRLRGESTAAVTVRDLLESSGEDPYGERGAERGWIFPDDELKCEGDEDEEEEDDKKAWRKTTPPILVEPRENSGGPVFLMSKGANIFFRVQSQAQMGKIKKGSDINNVGYMSLKGNRSSMLRNLKDQQDEKERVKLALLHFKARRGWSRSWENLTEAARGPIEANVITIQTCARRFLARRFRARLNVANELLLTEKSYVKALSVVVEMFYYPLLMEEPQLATTTSSTTTTTTPTSPPGSAGGCRASTELQQMRQTGGRVATIFSVADKLLFAHRTFCAILNERLRNLDEFRHKGLGDIFLKKTRFFDVYVKYINNFQSAIETLNRCKAEDPAMAKFIAECEAKKECGYMDLSSFLIQPVQRIPRYVLLLNQLLRKTTAGTKVHAELYRAVEKMRQATHHLNEQKRDAENAEYVAKLCSALVMPNSVQRQKRRRIASFDFSAERRFIKEGDVTLLASKFTPGKPLKKARSEELHLMLFNDVLLMCTRIHSSSRERRRSVRAALKSDDSMVGGPAGPNGGSSSGSSDGDGGSGGGGGTLHRLLASIPGMASPPSSRRLSLHSHTSAATSSPSSPSSSSSAPMPVTQLAEFTSPPSSPQSYSPLSSPGHPVKYDIQEVVELWKVHVLDLPADTYGEGLVVVSTPLRSFVFAFGSAATKGEWMTALQSAVQRLFTSI